MINATVKLVALPETAGFADARANAGAVVVSKSDNDITLTGKLDDLVAFPSSVQAQGTHKWVAIDIDTHLKSIVGATWNGTELTQTDVDEAASVGLAAGHIIYWAKADVLVDTPYSITIGAEGKDDLELTVSFVEAE